jgi:regulator of cell morphogenesis and NO signaling
VVLTVGGVTPHTPQTLADIVTETPAAARVLDGFGLDYCLPRRPDAGRGLCRGGHRQRRCGGQARGPGAGVDIGWTTLTPPALADHIVETHHRYLHEELPLLDALAAKVLAAHASAIPSWTASVAWWLPSVPTWSRIC